MKSVFVAVVVSTVLAIPTVSFAQTSVSTDASMAQTQPELSQSSVGGASDGSSGTGSSARLHTGFRFVDFLRRENTKAGRPGSDCVGPASFCNIYFGGN